MQPMEGNVQIKPLLLVPENEVSRIVAEISGVARLWAQRIRLRPFEELLMKTPIAGQRHALAAAGAPLTDETCGTDKPRAGIMPT